MTIELLIQAVVRQTTVLIAQLATAGGARAPLAQIANQVFLDLANELGRQGVSRKVSADMFGLGLRTYQRKIRRLLESATEHGRPLWEAILELIREKGIATRAGIEAQLSNDDIAQVRGILRDLCESGLIFASGQGPDTMYRAVSEDELRRTQQFRSRDGLDELVWAMIFHAGCLSVPALAELTRLDATELQASLERLLRAGRVTQGGARERPTYTAGNLYIPLGAPTGWEAAVFDHFQAMVKTICCRLRESGDEAARDTVGGSTYTLDLWEGHPLEDEVRLALSRARAMMVDLRERVEKINTEQGLPERFHQVLLYVGQCSIKEEPDEVE